MMAAEGPFLAALIARLADPKANLAAYGVITSLAWIVESPIMMLLSASNSLVRDGVAYRKFRQFAMAMNLAVTAVMLVLLAPPVFSLVARGIIGLPADVAGVSARAMVFLILWPGSIGYRRFYQGILIRRGRPRAVTAGTIIRLSTMAAVGAATGLAGRMEEQCRRRGARAESCRGRRQPVHGPALGQELKAMPEADCGFGRDLNRSGDRRGSASPQPDLLPGLGHQPHDHILPRRTGSRSNRWPCFRHLSLAFPLQDMRDRLPGGFDRPARRSRRTLKIPRGFAEKGRLTGIGRHGHRPVHSPRGPYLEGLSGLSGYQPGSPVAGPHHGRSSFPRGPDGVPAGFLVRARKTWPVVKSVAVQIMIVLAILWATVFPLRLVGALAAGVALVAGAAATAAVLALHSRRLRASRPPA
jgi:hypothetical protein